MNIRVRPAPATLAHAADRGRAQWRGIRGGRCSRQVRHGCDHARVQVIQGGDGARRDARGQCTDTDWQGIVAGQGVQQLGGDAAVVDRRDRPGQAAQAGRELLQPGSGIPGGLTAPGTRSWSSAAAPVQLNGCTVASVS